MPKSENKTFVLNDETQVNSYGFRIPNKGIDLARFEANPVVLDQHINSTSTVIGKWVNIRTKGSQLLADLEFDIEDESALKIKGKVDRGYINGVSMGVSFNRDNMKLAPDGKYDLVKSEIFEASIVAIPSNSKALKLYAETGELLTESEVKLSMQTIEKSSNADKSKMEKLVLTVAALSALGLQNADNATEVSSSIEKLKAQLDSEKSQREALQLKMTEQVKTQANALVDTAIASGKLSATVKDKFVEMATNNYALAAEVIAAMPEKTSLAATVIGGKNASEIKTADDFEKLSHADQLAFRDNNPEAYKKLFANS